MNSKSQIGFSQRIRLEWLEYTASLVLSGYTTAQINDALQALLREQISVGGNSKRGNREKAITILMRVWVRVPEPVHFLRNEGLRLLQKLPMPDHVVLHWGMCMAVYPFWGAVAERTGRLLRLQDRVSAAQVQRRLRETFGERETVGRAARRIVRAFIDWGILEETSNKGVYKSATAHKLADPHLIGWLVAAFLIANGNRPLPLSGILQSPALFPFRIDLPAPRELERSPELDVVRQGLDEVVVSLRQPNQRRAADVVEGIETSRPDA